MPVRSFGSLSNVGVRAQREQNPRPEGTEVSEPEGDSFECLDCVVATLGKPIGQAKIESVEYVGLPVEQRLAAGFEFGKFESVAGVEPEVETPQSGRAVGGIHEVVEGFLEGVGLQKPVREAEHDVHSGAILIGKALAMGEQQTPGALEVTPLFLGKGRLEGAPGVLHGLRTASHHMEPVDNDLGVGQESPGDVSEASVHVHDDVLHFVPVGEGAKIFLNGQGGSVRQDVEHAAIQRVCDDTLKGLAARVALEFVKGEGLRQSLRLGDGHDAQHAFHAADGGPRVLRDVLHAAAPAQQFHDFFGGAMGKAHIAPDKIVGFRKALPAGRAGVSPPTVQQPHGLSAQLQIAHLSNAVIVDPVGFPAAALADVHFSLHGNLQDDFFLCFI